MSAPPTGQRGEARRLGRMFVGRLPSKPPGRVHMALDLSVFVAWCSLTALSWGAMPPLLTLAMFVLLLGAVLRTLGNLALYHRWGGRPPRRAATPGVRPVVGRLLDSAPRAYSTDGVADGAVGMVLVDGVRPGAEHRRRRGRALLRPGRRLPPRGRSPGRAQPERLGYSPGCVGGSVLRALHPEGG